MKYRALAEEELYGLKPGDMVYCGSSKTKMEVVEPLSRKSRGAVQYVITTHNDTRDGGIPIEVFPLMYDRVTYIDREDVGRWFVEKE